MRIRLSGMRNKNLGVIFITKNVLHKGFLLHRRTGEAYPHSERNGSISAYIR